LPILEAAKGDALPITSETCPHYLHLSAEQIPDGQTQFKCAPPIREAENGDKLWEGLSAGVLDMVVSDHSPCTPQLKLPGEGDFLKAWGGIASLQLTLAITWTEAQKRGDRAEKLVEWMCQRPAELAGLSHRKGRLAPGFDADIVIWDPEQSFQVSGPALFHRHPVTPYDGERLYGVVRTTILAGETVFANGALAGTPRGRLLTG
jgi:allantoinase